MNEKVHRIRSELPGGDPTLMNRLAWARRWVDRAQSITLARQALETAKSGTGRRSKAEQGIALKTLAWHANWQGENDEAMKLALKAETFLSEADHPKQRARIYTTLGLVHFSYNRIDLARSSIDRGEWLLREIPEEDVSGILAELLMVRALIQRFTGERARSGITVARARELATSEVSACCEWMLSYWLLEDDSEPVSAREYAQEALEDALSQNNTVIQPYLYEVLGSCASKESLADQAAEYFDTGARIAIEGNDKRAQCLLLRSRGLLEQRLGNDEGAVDLFKKAAVLAKTQKFILIHKTIALDLADLFERMKKYKQAVDQHKLAWRLQNETRMR